VTNPRLASRHPVRWAAFRGITILFDNSADGLSSDAIDFYDGLEGFMDQNAAELEAFGLCRLPRSTYHVTLLDLVNEDNVDGATSQREGLRQLLVDLPQSSHAAAAFLELIDADAMLKNAWPPVAFAFDVLAIWSNAVLVARLRLDGAEDTVVGLRTEVNRRMLARCGIQASATYRPHVTLGYFADVPVAVAAHEKLAGWTVSAGMQVGELRVHFQSASLYGFTTLVDFFRC
jgi:2'-5' RNA ligase superfamily protein